MERDKPPPAHEPRASLPKMQAVDIRARALSLAIQAAPLILKGTELTGPNIIAQAEIVEKWLRDAPT